jgi:DNA-directed RNA polymerase subunit RPC12/RpoP
MTMHSTIYSRCPSCHKDGLVQPVQATYRCAVCNFDYLALAKDQAAREAWPCGSRRSRS